MGETPVDQPVFDQPTAGIPEPIAEQLVNTHPAGVIRKLRDELSLLLDDLNDSASE